MGERIRKNFLPLPRRPTVWKKFSHPRRKPLGRPFFYGSHRAAPSLHGFASKKKGPKQEGLWQKFGKKAPNSRVQWAAPAEKRESSQQQHEIWKKRSQSLRKLIPPRARWKSDTVLQEIWQTVRKKPQAVGNEKFFFLFFLQNDSNSREKAPNSRKWDVFFLAALHLLHAENRMRTKKKTAALPPPHRKIAPHWGRVRVREERGERNHHRHPVQGQAPPTGQELIKGANFVARPYFSSILTSIESTHRARSN